MKGKYLVILLLIITFICAFCKYSKNVQVRELFIDDKEVKELFNTGTGTGTESELRLDNLEELNLECAILEDQSTIALELNEIHNLYDSALDSIDNTANKDPDSNNPSIKTIKNKYVEDLTDLNDSYKALIAQDDINSALAETKESINTDETPCKGYIIPLKKNEEKIVNIGSAISAITDEKQYINTNYDSLNKVFNGKIDIKLEFLKKNEENFNQTNNSIITTLNALKSQIDTLPLIDENDENNKSYDENNKSYQKRINDYCNEIEIALSDLIGSIGDKISQNTETITQIDETISTYLESPTTGDQPNAKYNGIDNEDLSIRKHCNIGVNGSGICYEPEYQGCKIECDLKTGGVCKTFEQLGYPNPQKYTNIFGDSIKVHTHSHDHGPNNRTVHTHNNIDDMIRTIENSINIQDQKLENIKNEIDKTSSGSEEIPKLKIKLENIKNEYINILYNKLLDYKELNNNNQDIFIKTKEIYIESKLSDISTLESQLLGRPPRSNG